MSNFGNGKKVSFSFSGTAKWVTQREHFTDAFLLCSSETGARIFLYLYIYTPETFESMYSIVDIHQQIAVNRRRVWTTI